MEGGFRRNFLTAVLRGTRFLGVLIKIEVALGQFQKQKIHVRAPQNAQIPESLQDERTESQWHVGRGNHDDFVEKDQESRKKVHGRSLKIMSRFSTSWPI